MAARYREAILLVSMGVTALFLFGMGAASNLPLVLFSIALSVGFFSLGTRTASN